MIVQEIEARFWVKVDWSLTSDRCWPWLASKMWRGYGQFSFVDTAGHQRVARAHRLAYELMRGPIPHGLHVDHTCHNPLSCTEGEKCPHRACCNPSHMKLVTNAENHAPGRINAAAGGRACQLKRQTS